MPHPVYGRRPPNLRTSARLAWNILSARAPIISMQLQKGQWAGTCPDGAIVKVAQREVLRLSRQVQHTVAE